MGSFLVIWPTPLTQCKALNVKRLPVFDQDFARRAPLPRFHAGKADPRNVEQVGRLRGPRHSLARSPRRDQEWQPLRPANELGSLITAPATASAR